MADAHTPQVLIVGAGYTGRRLATALIAYGHAVTCAQRSRQPVGGANIFVTDLDDATSVQALQQHLTAGQQLRVAYLVPPPADLNDADATDTRLAAFLHALPATTERVVLASTTGVYGDHQGRRVDETTPTAPSNRRAIARVAAEQTLARWSFESNVETGVLRIAGIYGPGRLPLQALRDGTPVVNDAESGPGNRIHVDDLVRCFERALFAVSPPPIVNISDGDHRSTARFQQDVAQLADLPTPVFVSMAEAEAQFSPMRLSFIRESRALDNSVLRNDLGVTLQYADPRDGIAASLAEQGETTR
ncbi:MAG: NAD-dependent epimerase/dehydratase family protein [Pseudomonadota bacterium]